ncbi:MAG: hypothetical protein IKN56_05965 [Clostridia bacterium]|nr:hypothetical protein [Clostridia bacterium]
MNLEKIFDVICEALGYDSDDISKDTLLEELISDEYEMQELIENISSELDSEISVEPAEGWTLRDLARAISESE